MQNLSTDFKYQIEEERLPSAVKRQHVWPYTERQAALASSYFGCLPNEILVRIFRSLPVYDLVNVGLVCRTFKMVADLEEVWKNKHRIPLRSPAIDISPNAKWAQNGLTVAGGNDSGSGINQLFMPQGLYVDDDQMVYVADWASRIVAWKHGATSGQMVAGGNGHGDGANQLVNPTDVVVDKERDCLIVCDRGNGRVVRWPRRNGTSGETIISNISCTGLTMDENGSLYIVHEQKHEVRRYRTGNTEGTVVAGGNGRGNRLDQLDNPWYVFVDRDHSVYVSDSYNNRVMKWEKGATEGIAVAGGQDGGNSLTQLSYPQGVVVDQLGTVYVSDASNHRVMRWPKGGTQGSIIAGGNGKGTGSNQLNHVSGLSFDRHGNLYVVDDGGSYGNTRVQKFNIKQVMIN